MGPTSEASHLGPVSAITKNYDVTIRDVLRNEMELDHNNQANVHSKLMSSTYELIEKVFSTYDLPQYIKKSLNFHEGAAPANSPTVIKLFVRVL
jgi:hypothetical protein